MLADAVCWLPNCTEGAVCWFDLPLNGADAVECKSSSPPANNDGREIGVTVTDASALEFAVLSSPIIQPMHVQPQTSEPSELSLGKTIPVAPESDTTPQEIIARYGLDLTRIRLLIVEDEKMLLKFAKKMFASLGFVVDEACDGSDALPLMKINTYHVVLMDQNMPRLTGLAAVRLFREWQHSVQVAEQATTPHDPSDDLEAQGLSGVSTPLEPMIFMMSASILPNDREEAHDLKIANYFAKPLQLAIVASTILQQLVSRPDVLSRIQR